LHTIDIITIIFFRKRMTCSLYNRHSTNYRFTAEFLIITDFRVKGSLLSQIEIFIPHLILLLHHKLTRLRNFLVHACFAGRMSVKWYKTNKTKFDQSR